MNFSFFYSFFRSIVVSSLIVHSYDYRSSANDFCTKSHCPGAAVFRQNRTKKSGDAKNSIFALNFIYIFIFKVEIL